MNIQEWKNIFELTQKYQTDQFWKDAFSEKRQFDHSSQSKRGTHDPYPKCDMYEGECYLIIEAEIPGLSENEVQVFVEKNTLMITGEFQTLNCERKYLLKERPNRKFKKELKLPFIPDCSTMKADFQNGLLVIMIPHKQA